MSKSKIALLLLILTLIVSACGGGATATPRPTTAPVAESTTEATEAVAESATEEATEAVAEMTEAATEEMATEEATAEMTEAATEEMVTEEPTAVAMAEVTEAATEEMATEEPTEAPTATVVPTKAPTATEAPTEVAMVEATEEATVEATVEPTAVPMEATEEATAEMTEAPSTGGLIPIKLQLQWVAQSQFAGYYAAVDQGFYEAEGLDVTILEGAVDIVPQTVVASGGAEFGIAWVPKVLASREQDADLVNIAQIFQRSGTLEVSFVDKGIESVADLKGMKVGTWGFGNEHELFAALRGADIDPDNPDDVTIVQQPFDMSLLLNGEVDAAEAMTYNEYAQVLEQENPATGELYQPDELNVIDFNDVGTAMLQDHIFTTESWLAGETDGVSNEDIAVKFIKASLKGWIYARDNFSDAVEVVLSNGPTLGKGHMTWQLNEINKLIWPSPDGIGILDSALWEQTVKVALDGKVITEEPSDGAFRTDLAEKAVAELKDEGVDVTGEDWKAETVEITPGGE
jgi:NitT/TauT family transport system substrate-binding protein